jgi:hypothetical protein
VERNLTRRANHRHIFSLATIGPRRQTGRGLFQSNFWYWTAATGHGVWLRRPDCLLRGLLLSVHALGVLAAIRQLLTGVDELSLRALLQKDGMVVDLFQNDGFRACRGGDRSTLSNPADRACTFGSRLQVANNRIAFGSSRIKVMLHLSPPLEIDFPQVRWSHRWLLGTLRGAQIG